MRFYINPIVHYLQLTYQRGRNAVLSRKVTPPDGEGSRIGEAKYTREYGKIKM
jgi:hypothetical protein